MKRFFAFVLGMTAVVCLAACSVTGGGSALRKNRLGCAFSSSVSIKLDRLEAEGTIKRFGAGAWEIELSEPNTLSGVKLEFSEGNVIASYKGLNFSVPQSAVPVKAMMLNLIQAVEENAGEAELTGEESDGLFKVKGSLDGGDYVLSVDEEGRVSGFDMPNNKLTMRFTEMKTAIETTTAVSASETAAETVSTSTTAQ